MSQVGESHDPMASFLVERGALLNETEESVLNKIYGPLVPDSQPYSLNEQSPTPLDGEQLVSDGVPYVEGGRSLMIARLDQRLMDLGIELKDLQYGAIIEAMNTEHDMRIAQNKASMSRLHEVYIENPSEISLDMADNIFLARMASASLMSIIKIIAKYPQIASIETVKYTKPLDPINVARNRSIALAKLRQLQNGEEGFSFQLMTPEETRGGRRSVPLGSLNELGTMATKAPIARASYDGIDLVLKERESYFLFPASQSLGSNPPNIRLIRGQPVNVQPIGFSHYLAVDDSNSLAA